jgi:Holliday junction DNA helicase RuvB
VGIDAVASSLNEETDTIQDVVEPYLLKIGFLRRTPRGRELTEKALEYMGKREKQGELF